MKKMVNGVIVDMTPEEIAQRQEEESQWQIYKQEWDSKQYARDRAAEYPSLADFADAYYWAQNGDDTKMTAYIEKCAAVKEKYPKA
jgi:hypothetical protein